MLKPPPHRHYIVAVVLSLLCAVLCPPALAGAVDVYIFPHSDSEIDHRGSYAAGLLKEVLRRTEREFGPYRLEFSSVRMERSRQFEALKAGQIINVAALPSSPDWERGLTAIMIPVDLGLQSWRIAMIDKNKRALLRGVRTLDDLKRLRVGVGRNWVTYQVLGDAGFNVVAGNNFDGLFAMLMAGRFDYFPRSMKDAFDEYDHRHAALPALAVDDSVVMHHPFPQLFFVSPGQPRLAARISAGMEAMLKDGTLRAAMLAFHKDLLNRAALCSRRVFEIPAPDVNPELLRRREVWFDPMDPRNGVCPAKPAPRRG
jgi:hypothetical protein